LTKPVFWCRLFPHGAKLSASARLNLASAASRA